MKKLLKYLAVCLSFILLSACSKTEKSQVNDEFSYTEDSTQNIEVDQAKITADDNETAKKEFILLEDGTWDLKSNHKVKVVIEDIEDETDEEESEELEENLEGISDEEEIDIIDDDSYIEDDSDDDLADLTIVNDDELED